MQLLSYDSPFMTKFRQLVDYILLGLLWMVVSLPIFTFGAATTAALYTAEKAVHLEESKLLASFWKSFRREFKQATVLGLLQTVLTVLMVFNLLVIINIQQPGILLLLLALSFLIVFCWMQLWFGYLSKFKDTTKVLLGNTFRMTLDSALKVLLLALLSLAAIGGAFLCILFLSPLILLVPGIYIMLASGLQRWIFRKYAPTERNTN